MFAPGVLQKEHIAELPELVACSPAEVLPEELGAASLLAVRGQHQDMEPIPIQVPEGRQVTAAVQEVAGLVDHPQPAAAFIGEALASGHGRTGPADDTVWPLARSLGEAPWPSVMGLAALTWLMVRQRGHLISMVPVPLASKRPHCPQRISMLAFTG
ncbi:hypothetical protein DMR_14230 [Solidesulfovibrio magneticus RS-1]|uniref:Uncharacterized protein n=1 Tax=Solidesulfovibrio magneticus (strain ATCC 700980 / DSM 13731 / RS-1) TaxID=573370 RepID=C4XMF7_SOLM1|nr:hypothetical protein DMR_14230 [Solidesulfovibrio magneticus RS-1]